MKNRNTPKQTWSHARTCASRSIHQSPLSSGPLKKKRKTQNTCFQREKEREKKYRRISTAAILFYHSAATSANSRITKMYFTHQHYGLHAIHTVYTQNKEDQMNETNKLEYVYVQMVNFSRSGLSLSHSLSFRTLRARFVGRISDRRKKTNLLPQSFFSAPVLQQAANSAIASTTLSYRRTACTKEANECVYHLFLRRVFLILHRFGFLFCTETNALPLHTSGPAGFSVRPSLRIACLCALFICIASSSHTSSHSHHRST